ncbi:MAG: 50S ribosomal protein L13 [Candidatus Shapirobacteria bacterium]|nr:50S ribosomal protein L13 [Candidatus Shapirobacteria bacterium]
MKFKTKATKANEIKREWHLIDAKDQILGRMAVKIASLLMGKEKTYLVNYLDCGDYVVVINAEKVQVTGRKREQTIFYRHSGYPGGFKEVSFKQQMAKDPTQIIRHAVSGMLPKNKLRDMRLARLKIFAGSKYDFEDKFVVSPKKEIVLDKEKESKKDGKTKKD